MAYYKYARLFNAGCGPPSAQLYWRISSYEFNESYPIHKKKWGFTMHLVMKHVILLQLPEIIVRNSFMK
jgi:hypothetical protein